MVSKSKTLGKPTLILVSTGSTKFPFPRLFSVLQNTDEDKYRLVDGFLPTDKLVGVIKKADKIIVHGGPATIYNVVKYAKVVPLIIPRLKKFREHVDDHQFFFCKYLRGLVPDKLKNCFVLGDDIENAVKDYLSKKTQTNSLGKYLFIKKTNKLIDKLEDFTKKK